MQFAAIEFATVAPPALPAPPLSQSPTPTTPPSPAHADGLIEIKLPSGVSVRFDGRALRRVLGALEGR